MKLNKLVSIIKKLHKLVAGDGGFTLVEAIATVAIVGIVVTPIAMVFQGALLSSLETRTQLKANQLGQQYIETIETMEYEELKRLVDDYAGIISSSTISTGGFDLPEPIPGYDVTVDLHYAATRSDGTTDPKFNLQFNSDKYILSPTITDAPFLEYNLFMHLKSADNNGVDFYDTANQYDGGVSVSRVAYFDEVAANRQIKITYNYTSSDKANTIVDVSQGGSSTSTSYGTGSISNAILVFCDDDFTTTGLIQTSIEIESFVEEEVSLYVYESIDDKIRPNIVVGLGNVNVVRGLSVIDTTTNTHRIYEIEVTIRKEGITTGEPLTHIITTRLAK